MKTINSIAKYMNSNYPKRLKEPWDSVGLIYGSPRKPVEKIMVGLDLTTDLFEDGIKQDVDLFVVHHPFKFATTKEELEKEFKEAPYKESLTERIVNTKSGLFVAHTNFDKEGMKDALTKKLGFKKYKKVPGSEYGMVIETKKSVEQAISMINNKLGLKAIQTNANLENVSDAIAFFPGGFGDETIHALTASRMGANIIVCSEIKNHHKITLQEEGINVLVVDHIIENVFVDWVVDYLQKQFKDIKVIGKKSKEVFRNV